MWSYGERGASRDNLWFPDNFSIFFSLFFVTEKGIAHVTRRSAEGFTPDAGCRTVCGQRLFEDNNLKIVFSFGTTSVTTSYQSAEFKIRLECVSQVCRLVFGCWIHKIYVLCKVEDVTSLWLDLR